MKNQRKSSIIATIILSVVGIFSLATTPETNSKFLTYLTDDSKLIKYNSNLYSLNTKIDDQAITLYTKENNSTYISNSDTAYMRVVLHRNQAIGNTTEKETYTLELPKGCSLLSINKTGNITISRNDKARQYTFTFNKGFNSNDNGRIEFACDLKNNPELLIPKDDGKYLNINIPVIEKIDKELAYVNKKYVYNKLYTVVEKVPSNIIVIDTKGVEDPSTIRSLLIQEIIDNAGYSQEVTKYIENYLVNGIKPDGTIEGTGLKGISLAIKDSVYTYTLDNNFIGYARTYFHIDDAIQGEIFFSGKTSAEIDEAFVYYIQEYLTTNDLEAASILNYLETIPSIGEAILNNGTLPSWLSKKDITFNQYSVRKSYLRLSANTLLTTNEFKVYRNSSSVMQNTFLYGMNMRYSDYSIITENVFKEIVRIPNEIDNRENELLNVISKIDIVNMKTNYFIINDTVNNKAFRVEVTPILEITGEGENEVRKYYNSIKFQTISLVDKTNINLQLEYTNKTEEEIKADIENTLWYIDNELVAVKIDTITIETNPEDNTTKAIVRIINETI